MLHYNPPLHFSSRAFTPAHVPCVSAALSKKHHVMGCGWRERDYLSISQTPHPSYKSRPGGSSSLAVRAARRQGSMQLGDLVEGPQVWTREDVDRTCHDWTTRLTEAHVKELESAVADILGSGRARVQGNFVQLVRRAGGSHCKGRVPQGEVVGIYFSRPWIESFPGVSHLNFLKPKGWCLLACYLCCLALRETLRAI